MVNRKHLSQNMAFGLFRLLSLSVVGILLLSSVSLYIKV